MALQAGVQVNDDEDLAFSDDPLDNAVLQYVFRRTPRPHQIPTVEKPQQEVEAPPQPSLKPKLAPAATATEPP